MRDISMPAALCSATGLSVGLLMYWSSKTRSWANLEPVKEETFLRIAMGHPPLRGFITTGHLSLGAVIPACIESRRDGTFAPAILGHAAPSELRLEQPLLQARQ